MGFFADLTIFSGLGLILALALALSFEFVNGFHDTANAVATVIYTNSLKPNIAVVWSGIWNLIGVLTSKGTVAFGIIALLPVDLVINAGSNAGFAMVFSLLLSAIAWNIGTWYLGLPASSSHSLIGSILGVGVANSLVISHAFDEGVNWAKAQEVMISLLVSPLVGFACAAILLLIAKALIRIPQLYESPNPDIAPPIWIRSLLILTCTGVSFVHGSNDGQKGMGLIMLILIGIIPGIYSLNLDSDLAPLLTASPPAIEVMRKHSETAGKVIQPSEADAQLTSFLQQGKADEKTFLALAVESQDIEKAVSGKKSFKDVPKENRGTLRKKIYFVNKTIAKLTKQHLITEESEIKALQGFNSQLEPVTEFIPIWVKVAVALALGCGTMIGWKRIVVTVGEKIGKEHLTYAQGASAELVAMCTTYAGDRFGLPVSTTHVLSSGIAGTMAANGSGLQQETLKNIILAWVLTLPACMFMAAALFSASLFLLSSVLGLH